jgi:hypothetical protein
MLWTLLTRRYGAHPYLPASAEMGVASEFLETWIPRRAAKQTAAPRGGGDGNASVTLLVPR